MKPSVSGRSRISSTSRESWLRSPPLEAMRSRPQIGLSSFEECADCPYTAWCTGNCAAVAYSLTGDLDRPSPDACLKRFLDGGGTLP